MGVWAKNTTKFVVSVSFITRDKNIYGCVPKPVLAKLRNLKRIRYTIQNDRVLVSNVDSQ